VDTAGRDADVDTTFVHEIMADDEALVVYSAPSEGAVRASSAWGVTTLFQGREWHAEVGLYYFRARWYEPRIGFLEPDPRKHESPDPYQVLDWNTSNAVDPFGESAWVSETGTVVIGAVTSGTKTTYVIPRARALSDLRTFRNMLVNTGGLSELEAAKTIREVQECRPTVILDPGHGREHKWGSDSGAPSQPRVSPGVYPPGTVFERDIALEISLALAEKLSELGVPATLTRTGNSVPRSVASPRLSWRANQANSDPNAAAFVSVHLNSTPTGVPAGSGLVVYWRDPGSYSPPPPTSHSDKELAESIVAHQRTMPLEGTGIAQNNFVVIRETSMPGVLIEFGYINNPSDLAFIQLNLDAIAGDTAEGIRSYLDYQDYKVVSPQRGTWLGDTR
jgi:N-acetylmuramoyl-L-alanine amidase